MTLVPSTSWNVAGVEGDKYTVGPFCDRPGCKLPVDHKHHMWRRSFLGGDYWWVRVPTPRGTTVIRNVIGLCYHHHEEVTGSPGGHGAWIRWIEEKEELQWLQRIGETDDWQRLGQIVIPAPSEEVAPRSEVERCPTCGKPVRHDEHEHEPRPKRPRKSWVVQVPADNEDGAAVLDELVESLAELIGTGEYRSQLRRYHTLIPALVFALQHGTEFSEEFLAA